MSRKANLGSNRNAVDAAVDDRLEPIAISVVAHDVSERVIISRTN